MRTHESQKYNIHRGLHIGFALRLVWQSAPGWTIASLVLLTIQGVLPLLALYLMKLILDAVSVRLLAPGTRENFKQVVFLIVLAGLVTLCSMLCRSIARLVSQIQSQVISDHIHDILHAKSIEVDLEYYENAQFYDTLHRAQQEAPFRPANILNNLGQIGQSGIALFTITGLLFFFHWGIALLLFIAVIPDIFVRVRYAKTMYHWQRDRTSAERRASYFHWMLTGIEYAKEIRLFDLGSLFMHRFRDLRKQLRHEKFTIAARRSLAELGSQAGATIAVFGAYTFIAYQTVQGVITLGALVMYFQAFQRAQGFFRDILSGLAGLYEDNLFLSNFYEFLELQRKVVDPLHPKPITRPIRTEIVFDHVSFRYSTSPRDILEDISLCILPGEKIAIVGENGAGKTTLIKLLCRLYDPDRGTISIDGIDLREFETMSLRREISVIFQDYAHYHLTARENIWFGNITLAPEHQQIVAAARTTGADDVITRLPQGYETILGKWFKGGEELSIGEWQKIALARAFLRDAQIIVLDEPTSAMDALAEYEVFTRFRQLAKDRTAIIISHRFSTVRMADRIYVMQEGRIIESGTHDKLIQYGGTYKRMFETQAQHYR